MTAVLITIAVFYAAAVLGFTARWF